jgi:hypothetical protein
LAISIRACHGIVDVVPIADVEPCLGTISPNGILQETRKVPWEFPVELSAVDIV